MKRIISITMLLTMSVNTVMAQEEGWRNIYPWRPMASQELNRRLVNLTENQNPIKNVFEMDRLGLSAHNTKNQPWGGSFWPLLQGMVANTYQDKDFGSRDSSIWNHLGTYVLRTRQNTQWKYNYKEWEKRKKKVYPKIWEMKEEDLAKLAPSEKYDLLLGDTNFSLTNVIWDYTAKRGEEKKIPFLREINIPEGYELGKESHWMAFWEGICHGWAPAAGHYPRPQRTVWVTLQNGKRMPFYPNDLKALISLMFANSEIQGKTIMEGSRCDEKKPSQDEYGRYYDTKIYKGNTTYTPNCADVHPGVLHVAIMNILGIEGRSFVVEKSAKDSVANQPVSGYELVYFNPLTGKDGSLRESVLSVDEYRADPFSKARNPETRSIVGVHMKLKYTDWENPKAEETNYASDDKIKDVEFKYDLELDYAGNVVGGQWRVNKDGSKLTLSGETHQPDFFWVIPRDWKSDFRPEANLPAWNFAYSTLPPKEYAAESLKKTFRLNPRFSRKCWVEPKKGGEGKEVDCVTQEPGPQPLTSIIETLVNEARR